MEIRQLKYFVGVAEAGSISEASRRFYLSQSAISQQIKALEDELSTTLFVRTSHHLSLTESGEMLLPLARQVVRSVNDCAERMADLNDMLCGDLSVGFTFSLEPYVRPAILRFLKTYPKVRLNVLYKTIPELRDMLHARRVDVIICVDSGDAPDDSIIAEPVLDYKLCAIMRDTHPLASRPSLNFQDMALQHFVLPEAGIRDRNAVEHYLRAETGNVDVRAIINDPNALLNLVHSSNYISILTEAVINGRQGLCAVPVDELSTPVTAYVQTLRNAYMKRSAKAFVQMLSEMYPTPSALDNPQRRTVH